jgi:hypothetical protein
MDLFSRRASRGPDEETCRYQRPTRLLRDKTFLAVADARCLIMVGIVDKAEADKKG